MYLAKRCDWEYSDRRQTVGIVLVVFCTALSCYYCEALSMMPSPIKVSKVSSSWLDKACIVWDPSMINENECYWNEEWLSILRTKDTEDDSASNPKNESNHDNSSHSVSYQTLFTIAALLVAELREKLKTLYEKKSGKTGIPVVVAIPEGPLLPLATLVVHGLNYPQDEKESLFAILVPIEPSEAKKRNLHILKDISSPSVILTVPGKDSDNLRAMAASLSTIDPAFVDLTDLLQCVNPNMDKIQDITKRTVVDDGCCWDVAYPIGRLVAKLASEVSHTLHDVPTTEKYDLSMEPRVSHIVYTSGTTGVPKGCISSIASLEHYLRTKNEVHCIDESSVVLLASALSFDPCLSDCLATFQAGATLALAPRSALLSSLPNILQQIKVTHVLCTPTLWSLMGMYRPSDLPTLQVVALGGEPIPTQLQKTWGRKQAADSVKSCRLFATYGVTEACVYQTCGEVFASATKSKGYVGQPFQGLGVRVCKEGDQDKLVDVEPGSIGEIVLYGSQLDAISGYLKRPELNRKFQMDGAGTQHYRTGDRGIFDVATNSLYVSGRIVGEEGMVKVNGVRVELGEIENALIDEVGQGEGQDMPVVLNCMAKVIPVSTGADESSSDRNEIRAFCVLSEQTRKELNIDQAGDPSSGLIVNGGPILTLLRSRCMENLKAACIPKVFVIISRLPLSPTGKRNRDGLPTMDSCRPLQSADEEPVLLKDYGKSGKKVAEVLTECLNLQPSQESMLTTTATFAMLGGDSLAATRVTRALYAYHYQVDNNRFLGGEYGKLTGAFDVISLLGSEDLGAYVELLDGKNLCQPEGPTEQSPEDSEHPQEPDDNDIADQPEDAEEVKRKMLYNALIQSITLGQSSIAIGLLSAGADPNYNLHSGRLGKVSHRLKQRELFRSSPIHLACMRGDDRATLSLLEKGSKINSPDASGLFPIHLASSGVKINDQISASEDDKKRLLCVKYLLEAGAPMTMRDGNKQSILHCAARAGHCELLRFVMMQWKEKNGDEVTAQHFFNWNDRWFRTPVHWAVLNGRVEALEVLLEMGCSRTPFKPKSNNRSSAAVESPMEMCQRLYDKADGGLGTRIFDLLSS